VAVTKTNGFAAPYRSLTLRNIADKQFLRNGLLYIQSGVTTSGLNAVVPPMSFVQNGMIVTMDAARNVALPISTPAPFLLTVTAPSATQNLDDLSFQWAKSPLDITGSEVIVAEWDGTEWRSVDMLSIDGIISAKEQEYIEQGKVGPANGLKSAISMGSINVDPGHIVDVVGHPKTLDLTHSFTQIAQDPDYDRVDRIVFRRPLDASTRIGSLQYLLGNTFGTPSTLYDTQLYTGALVHRKTKIVIASDNAAHFLTVEGYGSSFALRYQKYDSTRLIQLVAPTTITTATEEDIDLAQDSSGNLYLAYILNGNVMIQKLSSVGATIGAAYQADSTVNPCSKPLIAIDYKDKIYIAYRVAMGLNNNQYNITTRNTSGSLITAQTALQADANNYDEGHMQVTDDLLIYLAYTHKNTNQIYYQVRSDTFTSVVAATIVSNAVDGGGYGVLNGLAHTPKICLTGNKELFITFLQDKGAGDGVAIWHDGVATLVDLINPAEDFNTYDAVFDSYTNQIHFILSRSANTDYVLWDMDAVNTAIPLYVYAASYATVVKDKFGSLLHSVSAELPTSFTNFGAAQAIAHIGSASVVGGLNTIPLTSDEFLIASGFSFSVGDQVTFAGSGAGNDLNVVGDHYVVETTTPFVATESPAAGVTGQFASPDGNQARFVKSVSEVTQLRAFRVAVPESDLLLARVNDAVVLNYGLGTISSVSGFGVFGGAAIDWEKTLAGNLTIAGTLGIKDLTTDSDYNVAPGSYPMANGDALYVDVDGFNFNPVPQVTPISLIPFSSPILVLGFVYAGAFNPHFLGGGMGGGLESGEGDIVGEDLPSDHRARLGIISETAFQAYTSTFYINLNDTHPEAISNLDAALDAEATARANGDSNLQTQINAIVNDVAKEEDVLVTNPIGVTVATAPTMTWNVSNAVPDVSVFINGVKKILDQTGGLTKDWRKTSANSIEFSYTVPIDAVITFRDERTGGGGGGGGDLENINVDIKPDTNGARAVGSVTRGWKYVFLKDTTSAQVYRLEVVSGVFQITPVP
jgi:hypothetical protein